VPLSLDTEPDAEAVQLDIYRRMTPARATPTMAVKMLTTISIHKL
jgi:hypothetical protein